MAAMRAHKKSQATGTRSARSFPYAGEAPGVRCPFQTGRRHLKDKIIIIPENC